MRAAIVVAGGTGERFGRAGGKQLARLAGVPVIARTLAAVAAATTIDAVVLVCHPDRVDEYAAVAEDAGAGRVSAIVGGGATRRLSVAAGLIALPAGTEVVAVHDGARPLIEPEVIDRAVLALESSGADGIVVGHPAYDTLKTVGPDGRVLGTPDRGSLWVAQTPQVFAAAALRRAHAQAEADGFEGTDDASLVERIGGTVLMIEGPRWNLKVTVPEDLGVAEALLSGREGGVSRE